MTWPPQGWRAGVAGSPSICCWASEFLRSAQCLAFLFWRGGEQWIPRVSEHRLSFSPSRTPPFLHNLFSLGVCMQPCRCCCRPLHHLWRFTASSPALDPVTLNADDCCQLEENISHVSFLSKYISALFPSAGPSCSGGSS